MKKKKTVDKFCPFERVERGKYFSSLQFSKAHNKLDSKERKKVPGKIEQIQQRITNMNLT